MGAGGMEGMMGAGACEAHDKHRDGKALDGLALDVPKDLRDARHHVAGVGDPRHHNAHPLARLGHGHRGVAQPAALQAPTRRSGGGPARHAGGGQRDTEAGAAAQQP